ncbi:hypothetical protein ACQ4PT_063487 [Festuca glaucescens]
MAAEAADSVPPVDPLVKECSGDTTVVSLSPPLSPIPRPSSPPPSTTARTLPVFERGVFLGNVDVFLPPGTSSSGSGVFPSNEIRISRRSPASNRCPPLAVLQVISAYSLRCKLQENTLDLHPGSLLLGSLHSTCWNQRMTLVSCYNEQTFKTLMKKIESSMENRELDAATQLALRNQLSNVSKDHIFLKDFVEKRAITVDDEIVRSQDEKSMLHKPGGLRQVIVRPVIRVLTRNAVLTCLDPT